MISHIHHINFIVRDLNTATERYCSVFGLDEFIFDELDQRNVKTARVKIGETWLVLVQPIGQHGAPADYLRDHGEGFFLLSLATDDIDQHFKKLSEQSDIKNVEPAKKRRGLENWTVADLPINDFFGAQIQLTKEEVNLETK